jgi:hypothetical protein
MNAVVSGPAVWGALALVATGGESVMGYAKGERWSV